MLHPARYIQVVMPAEKREMHFLISEKTQTKSIPHQNAEEAESPCLDALYLVNRLTHM